MSEARFGRLQKAATLVPLAVLSAAWTASLVGVGLAGSSATSADGGDGTLPDGSTVPAEAIEAPASLSGSHSLAPGVQGDPTKAVDDAAANGIPTAALAAYQRAETVINAADTTCHLPWQLAAAIGRVESDHGRVGGSHLSSSGLAKPPIYGIPLDGSRGTTTITDTDAGALDGDTEFDRAVGPMQFIPSTWSVVGVDSDGDGQRNPQDIDDAALATAVYLCSGTDDLATDAGRRASVFRYNHSQEYVDLVLAFYQAYVDGGFVSVPNGYPSGTLPPSGNPTGGGGGGGGGGGQPTAEPEPTKGPTSKPTPTPTHKPTPTPTGQPTRPDEPADAHVRPDRQAPPRTRPSCPDQPAHGEPDHGAPDDPADRAAHDPADRAAHQHPVADPHPGRRDPPVHPPGPHRQPAQQQRRLRPVRREPHR